MKFETHDNKYLKKCLNCENEVENLDPEHVYCTQCGFPIRNECTGTSKFNSGYGNEMIEHDFEENEFILDPHMVYCPKCAAISLFAEKGLIENKYPKVDIVTPLSTGGDPFF